MKSERNLPTPLHASLVHDFLFRAAESDAGRPALVEPARTTTYGELASGAERVAAWLATAGVSRGDRVVLLFKNGMEYAVTYYGILRAGAVAVPADPALGGPALEHVLEDCRPRALASGRESARTVAAVRKWPAETRAVLFDGDPPELPEDGDRVRASLGGVLAGPGSVPPEVRLIDEDLASIIYTSGSTGRPKGVMLSHRNLVANTRSIVDYLELTGEDRVLAVLPFHYVYGKSLLNTHVAVGGAVIVDNRFVYPQVVLKRMQDEAATGFAGVPSTFSILLGRTPFSTMAFPALRYVTQAGGPMPPSVTRRLMKALPDKRIYIMYGATEAGARLTYLDPADLLQKIGSIGKAVPNVEVYPVREDGTPCAPDEVGELAARGSNIMRGYWNDPEETGRVLRNGLYYTGDLGRADRDGFLYVVGRRKNMIKVGGARVSPLEIEHAVAAIDGVVEAAVIGVDDEVLGEAPKAFVVAGPESGLTPEAVIARLKSEMAPFKVPREVVFLDRLPKNASGKVRRTELTALAPEITEPR
jgi:acyl-CoA synthetase (AMP-forming)/AMP-acid ligase II